MRSEPDVGNGAADAVLLYGPTPVQPRLHPRAFAVRAPAVPTRADRIPVGAVVHHEGSAYYVVDRTRTRDRQVYTFTLVQKPRPALSGREHRLYLILDRATTLTACAPMSTWRRLCRWFRG